MIDRIFRTSKPIVAMVHVPYKGSLKQVIAEALRDIERLERGGVDGLLFENWGGNYSNRLAPSEVKKYLAVVLREAAKITRLPYGINVLPLDFKAAFEIARETGAKFVQIDTFVDKVKTDYENRFIIDIKPQEIIHYRRQIDFNKIALFTNIQTKHYTTLPPDKKLETSARQAVQNGADVLVVTGKSTGKKTPKDKIIKVRKVSGNVPIFIGSGFDITNAEELLPYTDGVIVGTSLKYNGITENPVDEERVKQLIKIVHMLRK